MKSDMRSTTKTRLWVGTLTATWIALNVQVTTRNGIRIYPEIHEPCNNTENTENYETETTGKFRQIILATAAAVKVQLWFKPVS